MHDEWANLLPFYVTDRLSAEDRAAVAAHLAECTMCRAVVREWRAIAEAVQAEASMRAIALPPLSAAVRIKLRRRPTMAQAVRAAAGLVWAQRVVMTRNGLGTAVILLLFLSALLALQLRHGIPVALPLLALVPVVAALAVAFLYGPEIDPAFEIVAATPTQPGTLLLARLTLALGFVVSVAALASVLLSATSGAALSTLVGAWLGPLLLLSAVATVLALLWGPLIAAGVTLALWGSVVALLSAELGGYPLIEASLQPLLQPGWLLFVSQVVIAAFLWSLGALILAREMLLARKLEAT
jgi:hypothetical protein